MNADHAVTSAPIFVIGVPRSGTTLLSLMLDAHSRIAIPYESHFFVPYFQNKAGLGDLSTRQARIDLLTRILAEPYVRRWDHQLTLDEMDLECCSSLEATIDMVYRAYAKRGGKDVWGDKTPGYTTELDTLNKMFPNCRIIHLVRDGRDVALSLIQQWWGPNDFLNGMRYWNERVNVARKMLRMLPDNRYRELRFEDLVQDPRMELGRLTDFLQLPFEERMLDGYRQGAGKKVGERSTAHHVHLKEQLSPAQAYKWQRTLGPGDQAVAHEIAGPLLKELGYADGTQTHFTKPLRKAYHRLKESYAWRRGTPSPKIRALAR